VGEGEGHGAAGVTGDSKRVDLRGLGGLAVRQQLGGGKTGGAGAAGVDARLVLRQDRQQTAALKAN